MGCKRVRNAMRILIADDHEMIRTGLRSILCRREEWEIVGEAVNGQEAVTLAVQTNPHIALIDYHMSLVNGLEATRDIRTRLPATEVVMFTMHDDPGIVAKAFEAGARGYVTKSEANKHLLGAVEALAAHRPYVSERIAAGLAHSFHSGMNQIFSFYSGVNQVNHLTPGERVVSRLICDQHTDQDIAILLSVSVQSVGKFRSQLTQRNSC
jgi:DNA-binding NarL/FixJ family response regulator